MPGPSPDANLAEVLSQWTHAFGWSDRAAFLCGDDVYTQGEVHRGAARAAALLAAHGVVPGDRVAIALPGSIEFVWAFLGAVRIGAVAVLADPDASALPPANLAVCAPGRHPRTLTPAELIAAMPRAGTADPHPVLPGTPAYGQYSATYAHGDPEQAYLTMTPFGLKENDVLFSVPKAYDPVGLRDSVFLPLFSGASAVLDSDLRSIAFVAERRTPAPGERPALHVGVLHAPGGRRNAGAVRAVADRGVVRHDATTEPRRAVARLPCGHAVTGVQLSAPL